MSWYGYPRKIIARLQSYYLPLPVYQTATFGNFLATDVKAYYLVLRLNVLLTQPNIFLNCSTVLHPYEFSHVILKNLRLPDKFSFRI